LSTTATKSLMLHSAVCVWGEMEQFGT